MIFEIIKGPWHWSVSGSLIALVMFLLLRSGGEFGVSSNLRTLCTICGAGKFSSFFRFEWREGIWNLVFIAGSIIGGFLSAKFLISDHHSVISIETMEHLNALDLGAINSNGNLAAYVPTAFANPSPSMLLILLVGGLLVGFGARYAGGCTSGHAISGLSNLQIPSLMAVAGFFAGGLLMTWFIIPFIFSGGLV